MATKISTTYTAGSDVFAYPFGDGTFTAWVANSVECDEVLGYYSTTVDETDDYVWGFFLGPSAPTSWEDAIQVVNLQQDVDIRLLIARTTAGVTTSAAVATDGTIEKIIIGDDYLEANGRHFYWNVDAVTGFVAASCTCTFGGKYLDNAWLVNGTVVDNGDDTWTLKFDLTKNDTASLEPGQYRWSVEVKYNGTEITRVHSDCTTKLMEKQT